MSVCCHVFAYLVGKIILAGGKTLYDNDDLDDIDNIDDLDLCPVSKLGGTVEIHEANVSLTFKCNKHLHHFNVFNGIVWHCMVQYGFDTD